LLALGHRGQRVLSGLGLLTLVVLFSLHFLKPLTPGLPIAGVLMIVGGAVAFALGMLRTELATAVALGSFSALLGGSLATHFEQMPWLWGALVCGVPAFFISLPFYDQISVLLPPIAAAFAMTAGLARLLGPRGAGAAVPQLTLPWAFALLVVLAPLFLALSVARERRRERQRNAKKLPLSDAELEKKVARDRERGLLDTPPASDPGPGPGSEPGPF
jgi:hypothetical protein